MTSLLLTTNLLLAIGYLAVIGMLICQFGKSKYYALPALCLVSLLLLISLDHFIDAFTEGRHQWTGVIETGASIVALGILSFYFLRSLQQAEQIHASKQSVLNSQATTLAQALERQIALTSAAEERALTSDTYFSTIFEIAAISLWEVDQDGLFMRCNQSFCDLTGYSRDELVGVRRLVDITHQDFLTKENEYLQQLAQGESKTISYENRIICKDQTAKWVVASVTALRAFNEEGVRFLGGMQDITERRSMEKRLRWSEERHRVIAEGVGDSIITVDADGLIQFANAATTRIFGFNTKSIIGQPIDLLLPEGRTLIAGDAFWSQRQSQELNGQHQNGHMIHLEITATPIKTGSGRLMALVIRDDTERKSLHEKLIETTKIAEQANQAKSSFLAQASHEIRTPLTAVLGYADLLARKEITPEDQKKFHSAIKRNSESLTRIINDILDLSRIEANQLPIETSLVETQTLMHEVTDSFRAMLKDKNIELQANMKDNTPTSFVTDVIRLKQILINLVNNAIKFSESGSRVEIEVDAAPLNHQEGIVWKIRDFGRGIPLDKQSQLFQPFFQAHSSSGETMRGSGIGLCLSKKLAQRLGGDLQLHQSSPQAGSEFWVAIPFSHAMPTKRKMEVAAEPASDNASSAGTLDNISLLLVEDAEDLRILIRRYLEVAGAKVDTAEHGADAVEKALKKNYDCVLMDIQMPIMDGFTAFKELRARGFKPPIIALTAHAMVEEYNRCMDAGFSDYLSKPIDRKKLIEKIHQATTTTRPVSTNVSHLPIVVRAKNHSLSNFLPH